jgi:copper chaperone NosL
MKRLFILMLALFISVPLAYALDGMTLKPAARDKCPVCGMFVAKYPDFLALIVFKDGSYAAFDGMKDMMKCYRNMRKYIPGKTTKDIQSIVATEYYNLKRIDAMKAYYVIGSDVYGPMGKELIPFEKEPDAAAFLKDHQGRTMIHFRDINDKVMKELD